MASFLTQLFIAASKQILCPYEKGWPYETRRSYETRRLALQALLSLPARECYGVPFLIYDQFALTLAR